MCYDDGDVDDEEEEKYTKTNIYTYIVYMHNGIMV